MKTILLVEMKNVCDNFAFGGELFEIINFAYFNGI